MRFDTPSTSGIRLSEYIFSGVSFQLSNDNFLKHRFHFPELHRLDETCFYPVDSCNLVIKEFNPTCKVQRNGNWVLQKAKGDSKRKRRGKKKKREGKE